jgi:hypothetical protein
MAGAVMPASLWQGSSVSVLESALQNHAAGRGITKECKRAYIQSIGSPGSEQAAL